MKAAFFLLLFIVLVSGCASQGSSSPSSSQGAEEGESRYAQSLPATDMGASQHQSESVPEGDNDAVEEDARPHAREITLEEEIILARPNAPGPGLENNTEAPEMGPSSLDLNNTFTLQLVAMDTMEGAVNYAQQYRINPEEAGVARILSHGKIYFVLAYGVYANQTMAEQASRELQQQGVPEPWIRRLGTLERLSMEADDFQSSP